MEWWKRPEWDVRTLMHFPDMTREYRTVTLTVTTEPGKDGPVPIKKPYKVTIYTRLPVWRF